MTDPLGRCTHVLKAAVCFNSIVLKSLNEVKDQDNPAKLMYDICGWIALFSGAFQRIISSKQVFVRTIRRVFLIFSKGITLAIERSARSP